MLFHCLIFINPVAGIAAPDAVGAEVREDCTHISFPLAPPCDITVPHTGTFPVPVLYGMYLTRVASMNTSPPSVAEIATAHHEAEVV